MVKASLAAPGRLTSSLLELQPSVVRDLGKPPSDYNLSQLIGRSLLSGAVSDPHVTRLQAQHNSSQCDSRMEPKLQSHLRISIFASFTSSSIHPA